MCKNIHKGDHSDVLTMLNNVAKAYGNIGDYQKQEEYTSEAMETEKRLENMKNKIQTVSCIFLYLKIKFVNYFFLFKRKKKL